MTKVIKLGNIDLVPPRVVVSVTDQEDSAELSSLRADALELRVDRFQRHDIPYVTAQVSGRQAVGVPLILTIRNMEEEGGHPVVSDTEKLSLFQHLIGHVDAVDVELRSPILSEVVALARGQGKVVIVSAHDFTGTPEEKVLEEMLHAARRQGADITKIAAQAHICADIARLMMFTLKHRDEQVITMSLGDVGAISRLVFPAVGSLLTYTYFDTPSAPGQIQVQTLQGDLRRYYPDYDAHLIRRFGTSGRG